MCTRSLFSRGFSTGNVYASHLFYLWLISLHCIFYELLAKVSSSSVVHLLGLLACYGALQTERAYIKTTYTNLHTYTLYVHTHSHLNCDFKIKCDDLFLLLLHLLYIKAAAIESTCCTNTTFVPWLI